MKFTSYCSGLLTSFLLSYIILRQFSTLAVPILLCISASLGFVGGFLTVLCTPVAVILFAVHSGTLAGCATVVVVVHTLDFPTSYTVHAILIGWIVVVTIISIVPVLTKLMFIINTSVVGGGLVLGFFDVYIHSSVIINNLHAAVIANDKSHILSMCSVTWILFAGWLLLSLSGATLQATLTASTVTHKIGKLIIQFIR